MVAVQPHQKSGFGAEMQLTLTHLLDAVGKVLIEGVVEEELLQGVPRCS
jgi:hypothetical protein